MKQRGKIDFYTRAKKKSTEKKKKKENDGWSKVPFHFEIKGFEFDFDKSTGNLDELNVTWMFGAKKRKRTRREDIANVGLVIVVGTTKTFIQNWIIFEIKELIVPNTT